MLADLSPWGYLSANWSQVQGDLLQHVALTFIAVGIGFALALPMSLFAYRFPLTRGFLVVISGALYVIPSLALFTIIGGWTGLVPPGSYKTAEIALSGYTLLILMWNILAGLAAVPPEARESAIGMGYTRIGSLLRVELPLSIPYVFAGLRVATATVIGLVTVTALIGLGGLGQLATFGFTDNGYRAPIIDGLVLSIVLAAVCDLLWILIERLTVPWSRSTTQVGVSV